MIGDTILNAKMYHIISEEDAASCTAPCMWWNGNPYHYIREDTTKRIWKLNTFTMSDTLLYDFNLSVGDTIRSMLVLGGDNNIIQSIDSIWIGNSYRKIYYYDSSFGPDTCTHFLIEGIGSGAGLFSELCGSCFEHGSRLECFKQDGNILYYQGSAFCWQISTDTLSVCDFTLSVFEAKRENAISLSPNPATTEITITNAEFRIGEIEIYDVLGKKMIQESGIKSQEVIDVSSLASGIYFVKVKGEGGESVAKFVKQ